MMLSNLLVVNRLSRTVQLVFAVLAFMCLFMLFDAPKAAADACSSAESDFAQVDVYVEVRQKTSTGSDLLGYGKGYSFSVTATTPDPGNYPNAANKQKFAEVQRDRLKGNAGSIRNEWIPQGSPYKTRGAINSPGSNNWMNGTTGGNPPSHTVNITTPGDMHYCDIGSGAGNRIHPAFDFTNGTNGNPFLACLGGPVELWNYLGSDYKFGDPDGSGPQERIIKHSEFAADYLFNATGAPTKYVLPGVNSKANESGKIFDVPPGGYWTDSSHFYNGKNDGDGIAIIFKYELPLQNNPPVGTLTCTLSSGNWILSYTFSDVDGTTTATLGTSSSGGGTPLSSSPGSLSVTAGTSAITYYLFVKDIGPNNFVQKASAICNPPGNNPPTLSLEVECENATFSRQRATFSGSDLDGAVTATLTLPNNTTTTTSPRTFSPDSGGNTYKLTVTDALPGGGFGTPVSINKTSPPCAPAPVLEPHVEITGTVLAPGDTVEGSSSVCLNSGPSGSTRWKRTFWYENSAGARTVIETIPFAGATTISTCNVTVGTPKSEVIKSGYVKICLELELQPVLPATAEDNPKTTCRGIGKQPYIQVKNGDVNTTADVSVLRNSGTCTNSSTGYITTWEGVYGSGTELAAYSGNTVREFATALNRSLDPRRASGLLFANSPSNQPFSTPVGCSQKDPGWDAAKTSTLTGTQPYSGGTLHVNGNVYIASPVNSPGSFSLNGVPKNKVVATGNIYINSAVTNLDGIYMAGGTIYTCTNGNAKPTASFLSSLPGGCTSTRLTVNGALIAPQIKFLRLVGNVNDNTADETITYDPTVWLRALSGGSGEQVIDAYTTLPPIL